MRNLAAIEAQRLVLQQQLDAARSRTERNRKGQFATPPALASAMARYARDHFGNEEIRFLDPALGSGAFYSALLQVWPQRKIARATGFEIDPEFGRAGKRLWGASGLRLRVEDFTAARAPLRKSGCYNLLLCNPPYVRHHHLPLHDKRRLRESSLAASGIAFSGLAGLYVHFMALAHAWMSPGALAGWLIPSEFLDVNYGEALKKYLSHSVTLLRVHRFDARDLQFSDALVSSAIVWFRNTEPPTDHRVELTAGGSLASPATQQRVPLGELRAQRKWRTSGRAASAGATLGDFFRIRRGIATGANEYFVMSPKQAAQRRISPDHLRPILPGPKHLASDEVLADPNGQPLLDERRLLLDCRLDEAEVRSGHPGLWLYLRTGVSGIATRYLCHRRTPWYAQEFRPSTYFLCCYIARRRPDGSLRRFIFNRSVAIAGNSYLMLYPGEALTRFIDGDVMRARTLWVELCRIAPEVLCGAGRVYGGGMYKLEPRELANVPADDLARLLSASSAHRG